MMSAENYHDGHWEISLTMIASPSQIDQKARTPCTRNITSDPSFKKSLADELVWSLSRKA